MNKTSSLFGGFLADNQPLLFRTGTTTTKTDSTENHFWTSPLVYPVQSAYALMQFVTGPEERFCLKKNIFLRYHMTQSFLKTKTSFLCKNRFKIFTANMVQYDSETFFLRDVAVLGYSQSGIHWQNVNDNTWRLFRIFTIYWTWKMMLCITFPIAELSPPKLKHLNITSSSYFFNSQAFSTNTVAPE